MLNNYITESNLDHIDLHPLIISKESGVNLKRAVDLSIQESISNLNPEITRYNRWGDQLESKSHFFTANL